MSSITKVSEHIPSDFSMSTISSLRSIENKHDIYRGKDCMKTFCEFLTLKRPGEGGEGEGQFDPPLCFLEKCIV